MNSKYHQHEDFYLNKHILEVFNSHKFKISRDYLDKNNFKYNIKLPPLEDYVGPHFSISCKEPTIPNNVFSNEAFINNFLSMSPKQFDDVIYNRIKDLLDKVYSKDRYKVLTIATSYIPKMKEEFKDISNSLKEIQQKEYPKITHLDMEEAENIDVNKQISLENCSNPVWSRILNASKGLDITLTNNHFSVKGTPDAPYSMDGWIYTDGTIHDFLTYLRDIMNHPNGYREKGTPRVRVGSPTSANIIDTYYAIREEIKVIAKEMDEYFKDGKNIWIKRDDKINNIIKEVDCLLGKEELKLSPEMKKMVNDFEHVSSIERNSRLNFKIIFSIPDECVSNLTLGVAFDGTDKGLYKAIKKEQKQLKTDEFVHGFSEKHHLQPQYTKKISSQISKMLSEFCQPAKEILESYDFREKLNNLKIKVAENENDLTARGELYQMQQEASKYGINEEPVKLKTINDLKGNSKKEKYEPTIFR